MISAKGNEALVKRFSLLKVTASCFGKSYYYFYIDFGLEFVRIGCQMVPITIGSTIDFGFKAVKIDYHKKQPVKTEVIGLLD